MLINILIFIAVIIVIGVIYIFAMLFKNIMDVQDKSKKERIENAKAKIKARNDVVK